MRYTTLSPKDSTRTYFFQVEIVQEEDGRWSAWIDALPGCATWGYTKEEALRNIHDAAEAYIRDIQKAGDAIAADAPSKIVDAPMVAVTI